MKLISKCTFEKHGPSWHLLVAAWASGVGPGGIPPYTQLWVLSWDKGLLGVLLGAPAPAVPFLLSPTNHRA